jgi:hypothetical protein
MPNKACVETLLRLSVQRILDHLIICDYFRMQSLEKCQIPSSFSSRVIDNYHSLKKVKYWQSLTKDDEIRTAILFIDCVS